MIEAPTVLLCVTVSGTLREGKKDLIRLPPIEQSPLSTEDLLLYEQVQQQRQQAVVVLKRLLGDPNVYFRRAYHSRFHKVKVTEVGPNYVKGQLQIVISRNETFWNTYTELLKNLERVGDDERIVESDKFTFDTNFCTQRRNSDVRELMINPPGLLVPVSLRPNLSYPLLIQLESPFIDHDSSRPDHHILFKNVILSGHPVIDPPRTLKRLDYEPSLMQLACISLLRTHRGIYVSSRHINTAYPYSFLERKPAPYNAKNWVANTINLQSFAGRDVVGFLGNQFVLNFPVTFETVADLHAMANETLVDKLVVTRYPTTGHSQPAGTHHGSSSHQTHKGIGNNSKKQANRRKFFGRKSGGSNN